MNGERLSPQCVKKTVKFGGVCVMVRWIISSAGIGPIVRFPGNINANVYKELLHQHVLPRLRKGTVEIPIFMEINAPGHKAKTMLSFLEEEAIAVMKCPLQSLDMNPMETHAGSYSVWTRVACYVYFFLLLDRNASKTSPTLAFL